MDKASMQAVIDGHRAILNRTRLRMESEILDNDRLRKENEQLQEQNTKLTEALTPSGETKGAYIGEFSFETTGEDEEDGEYIIKNDIPWTTIKEIMKAIREYAAGTFVAKG